MRSVAAMCTNALVGAPERFKREDRRPRDHDMGPESAAPSVKVVIESKAAKRYTEADALEELAAARENREAQIGIFVFKRSSAPEGLDSFRRVGNDILAVWDADDVSTDVFLRAATSIARALAVREAEVDEENEASFRDIDRAVREIEKQVKVIDDITKAARAVQTKGGTILETAEHMKSVMEQQLESLWSDLASLRTGSDGA